MQLSEVARSSSPCSASCGCSSPELTAISSPIALEREVRNLFFQGSGSDFSDYFDSGSGSCFGSSMYAANSHFIPEIMTRCKLLQNVDQFSLISSSFIVYLLAFRIRRCPDPGPKCFFPDPAKSFRSEYHTDPQNSKGDKAHISVLKNKNSNKNNAGRDFSERKTMTTESQQQTDHMKFSIHH